MTIYVDQPLPTWATYKRCKMFADNIQELHAFAFKMGLSTQWFRNDWRLRHYVLTDGKRKIAIKLGAKEVTLEVTKAHVKANVNEDKTTDKT